MMKSQTKKTATIDPNEDKLKELILLISELSEGDKYFGATKLNKLLFFSDFLAYQLFGKSISGYGYEKKPAGPMLQGFYETRQGLEENGDIAIRDIDFWGLQQHRTIALRSADVSKFSQEEITLIVRVIEQHRDQSASQISAESHEFIGWQICEIGESIPYLTSLVSTRELTEEEWKYPATQKIELDELKIQGALVG